MEPTDTEGDELIYYASDSHNYNLLLWLSGESKSSQYLYSEQLEEGVNCEAGHSIITVTFVDSVTGASTDMSIGLEILPAWTYNQYVTLGLI